MTTSPDAGAGEACGARADSVLLRPAASCPGCGSRPALRVTHPLRAAARERPPEERLATYQCQRRGCGQVYPLVARHLRDAG
jgi:hypothetical protein